MYIVQQSGEIYSDTEFLDYIASQGFDKDDVVSVLSGQEKLFSEIENLKDICDDWELQCDGYVQNEQAAIQELEAIAEKLKSTKFTKAKAADAIIKIINDYF